MKSTITITFSEAVENHVHNQQIGEKLKNGLSCKDIKKLQKEYNKEGFETE